MKRHLPFVLAALVGIAAPAQAVTIRDLIELTKAGLGEEVLLALVEVDGGVFPVDAATLRSLKEAGVPESVIAAVIRSGRTPIAAPVAPPLMEPDAADAYAVDPYGQATQPAPATYPPEVMYVEGPTRTVVQEVPVPYYVTVPTGRPSGRHHSSSRAGVQPSITAPPAIQGPRTNRTDRPAPASPTYWGNGGKLRPDAWQPAASISGWGHNGGSRDRQDDGGRKGRENGGGRDDGGKDGGGKDGGGKDGGGKDDAGKDGRPKGRR